VPRRIIEEEMINEGLAGLDGSSIKGFVEIEDSDLVLKPDPQHVCCRVLVERELEDRSLHMRRILGLQPWEARETTGTSRRGLRST